MVRMTDNHKIPIGISSCLLGEQVRYNGGHKYDRFINGSLSRFFDFKPYCPEVAIGLGVPREPIRQVKVGGEIRILSTNDSTFDVTDKLHNYGSKIAAKSNRLCGYIFKAMSPSCGMERVKTYSEKGLPLKSDGVGAFAGELIKAFPNMPMEEEGRLNDPGLRENFIERVFTYYRWQRLCSKKLTPARLVEFHTAHKLAVMAHNQASYQRMGQLVSKAGSSNLQELASQYENELMAAMKRHASRKSHSNVLQHIQGYFSKQLTMDDRQEMTRLIDEYRQGLVPLIAPLTLIRHHLRHYPNEWVLGQTYLSPYPAELFASI
jgi:uncharacterized protein YbgA (DUF1722 family)/uncharacterized protein YbbK (DUF523 family)